MLALIFNRKHFKLILLACIPAGFSLIAWSGVLVWAVTGKAVEKYTKKNQASEPGALDSRGQQKSEIKSESKT
ncbi:superinfection immunity protein [Thalassotalea litorea]|uniref:Superinfection immunity protein n=2 Tax=Thalassotalea litorea TaxID=2020715 RepID=A0A5R9ILF4_9GAMM|nr:superinfection immunity protein [Thalassotalea litorea]